MKINSKILSANNLTVGYKHGNNINKVFSGIDVNICANELICILGPNGIGKSTLMRTLGRLQPKIDGEIFLLDININKYSDEELAKEIAYVLTDNINVNNLTMRSFVGVGRYPYNNWLGMNSQKDESIIDQALADTGIDKYKNCNLNELSDGVRQRATIARALSQETPILFLDEPTAFIDLPTKIEIMVLLKNLTRAGKTILLTTHDLDLAIEFSDRLWLLEPNGNLITGLPEDLILTDQFEKAFNKHDVFFEKMSGKFRINKKAKKSICLQGTGAEYVWTEKALQRNGFYVDCPNSKINIEITISQETTTWKIETQGSKIFCSSIEDVLNHLALEA